MLFSCSSFFDITLFKTIYKTNDIPHRQTHDKDKHFILFSFGSVVGASMAPQPLLIKLRETKLYKNKVIIKFTTKFSHSSASVHGCNLRQMNNLNHIKLPTLISGYKLGQSNQI